jgi:hypothetical protein
LRPVALDARAAVVLVIGAEPPHCIAAVERRRVRSAPQRRDARRWRCPVVEEHLEAESPALTGDDCPNATGVALAVGRLADFVGGDVGRATRRSLGAARDRLDATVLGEPVGLEDDEVHRGLRVAGRRLPRRRNVVVSGQSSVRVGGSPDGHRIILARAVGVSMRRLRAKPGKVFSEPHFCLSFNTFSTEARTPESSDRSDRTSGRDRTRRDFRQGRSFIAVL